MSLTTSEILLKAAELIEPPGRWTQWWWGRDRLGRCTSASSPDAHSWCVEGAIQRACQGENDLGIEANRVFKKATGEWPLNFGDAQDRTQQECVRALRDAAATVRPDEIKRLSKLGKEVRADEKPKRKQRGHA